MSDPTGNQMATMPSTGKGVGGERNNNLDLLMDVMLEVVVELGRTRVSLRQVLDLKEGSMLEIDRVEGDTVNVYVNDRLIARGDVVVSNGKIGVRISHLISTKNGET